MLNKYCQYNPVDLVIVDEFNPLEQFNLRKKYFNYELYTINLIISHQITK